MKPIVTILLRRFLMTLSAIFVWAKALARGKADPVNAEDRSKDSGGGQQKPNREPYKGGYHGVSRSDEDCPVEALRPAIEDKLVPEDEASLCFVQIRHAPDDDPRSPRLCPRLRWFARSSSSSARGKPASIGTALSSPADRSRETVPEGSSRRREWPTPSSDVADRQRRLDRVGLRQARKSGFEVDTLPKCQGWLL